MARKRIETPDPVDIYVGQRVRERRIMLGISQKKLADALDISFQQLQKYETGANRMGASRLYAISRILDVPVQWFFEGFQRPKSGEETGMPLEALKLAQYYRQLSSDERKTILRFVKSLAGLR